MHRVSIIIPTFNPGSENVLRLQDRLLAQTRRYQELIVVDSSSTDGSLSSWGPEVKVHVIGQRHFDHGGTRNFAAAQAEGDVLVFMTQDAIPANERWLEHLVSIFADTAVDAGYSRQIPRSDAKPLEVFARHFNYPETSHRKTLRDLDALGIKTYFFSNVCSAVRSTAFERVGGFPETTILNEDMVLAARLLSTGAHIVYVAESQVVHSHHYSIGQQLRRYFDIGASIAQNPELQVEGGASGEGARFLREQIAHLILKGELTWVPVALLEAAAKWTGFQLGRRARYLPTRVKRGMSMHSSYWS